MAGKQITDYLNLQLVVLSIGILGCDRTAILQKPAPHDSGGVGIQLVTSPTESARQPQMQPNPEAVIVQHCTEFGALAKHYTDKDASSTRDLAADVTQMKQIFDEVLRISIDSPESKVAHEALGEIAFELASLMHQEFSHESGAKDSIAAPPYDTDTLRVFAWNAFRKAASLGSQNAFTYDRIARLKLIRTGGRWEDPELVENILESMRLAPENGMSVRMLVLALLNSSFIDSGAFDGELIQVLPAQRGNSRMELERALDFLEGEWEQGQRQAERAAILGHIDVASQNEMMRNAKLKGMLRAALGISPFERRKKSIANH